jgi:aminoglycoside phosphotransferase (APT) family kinase protein
VFEHVGGRELWQLGDFDLWLRVAAQLARQHETLQRLLVTRSLCDLPLIEYSEWLANTWLERARRFTRTSPGVTRMLDTASHYLSTQGEAFYGQQPTLVHGDFYPANILLDETPKKSMRICVLDWELAGRGPGLLDLASFIAGKWTNAERRSLATAYYEAMSETAANPVDRRLFDRRLALARMQTAIRWLGWSDSWQPPAQQQNNWLAELEESLEELSLTASDH